jgi:hypothetical protein
MFVYRLLQSLACQFILRLQIPPESSAIHSGGTRRWGVHCLTGADTEDSLYLGHTIRRRVLSDAVEARRGNKSVTSRACRLAGGPMTHRSRRGARLFLQS